MSRFSKSPGRRLRLLLHLSSLQDRLSIFDRIMTMSEYYWIFNKNMQRLKRTMDSLLERFASVFVAVTTIVSSTLADDWPHWRGPNRDGVSSQSSQWSSGDWLNTTPDWVQEIGKGTSSPLVFQGHVFVFGFEGGHDVLRSLSLKTGHEEWTISRPSRTHGRFATGDEHMYGGPHATPEIDPITGLIYTLGIDGDLTCWNLKERGLIVWSFNLYDMYEVNQRPHLGKDWPSGKRLRFHRDYGYTCSPLVYAEWVIVEVGSTSKGTFMAFDKTNGTELWKSDLKDEAGHSGGLVPMLVERIPCVVGFTQRNVAVVRLDSEHRGETLGVVPWITDADCNIATPVVVGNSVLVTSSYNQSAIAKFEVGQNGMKQVWKQPYSSKVCSPVVHDGSVYFSWRQVHCLDWNSGELKWNGGGYGDPGSCIITADSRLIVCGGNGKIGLVEGASKSPKEFKELSVQGPVFDSDAWPHITFVAGRVLCRDRNGNLACFSIRQE